MTILTAKISERFALKSFLSLFYFPELQIDKAHYQKNHKHADCNSSSKTEPVPAEGCYVGINRRCGRGSCRPSLSKNEWQIEEIEIPDSCQVEVVEPKVVKLAASEENLILTAINYPIESKSLKDFIDENESFLVIVNDHARPTPTPKILKHVMPLLRGKRFGFVVACGTHDPPSEEDLRELILGEFYDELREDLVIHKSKSGDFIDFGKTSRGTPILVNKIAEEYKAFIPINSIEPHYFAGYTGGRKSFIPGISSYDTIEANHSMALLEETKIMALKDNPLHEDFEEGVRTILEGRPTFAINVVLDGDHNIVGAFGGDIFKQLYEGAKLAKEIYSPVVEKTPDVLISVVHSPFDQNLYQAQKGFENCLLAVKPRGIMILVASCYDGIGPDDLRIKELLSRLNEEVKEVILANNPNVEGEATALYLLKLIKPLGIKITRIARGIPVGTDIEYADEITLTRALEGRINF